VKTVLITGASGGIGGAAARLFAADGFNVVINYNKSREKAKRLESDLISKGHSALAVKADVSSERDVSQMFNCVYENFGVVDTLVNSAGIALQKLFTDVTPEEEQRVFGINLFGTINCCRAALPGMISRKCGRIVNVSSVWGVHGASCEVHYSAAKSAVIGFTKALAKEVGPSGILVNCVAPGIIDTEMNSCIDCGTIGELAAATPLGRMGTPEEVARLILFLASEGGDFITGQVIEADGGFAV
jgi:3-oxoacyl-[acyl-carrier protein] reductase